MVNVYIYSDGSSRTETAMCLLGIVQFIYSDATRNVGSERKMWNNGGVLGDVCFRRCRSLYGY